MIAGATMAFSKVTVVSNALHLNRWMPRGTGESRKPCMEPEGIEISEFLKKL